MEIKKISEIDPDQANVEYTHLTNLCYGTQLDPAEKMFFKKHFQNPFGQSYGNFIYDKEKLIATNLNLRWEFVSKNKIIEVVQPVDVQVHPEYRRAGLFRKGQEACMKDMPSDLVRITFPAADGQSMPGFLKWGWQLTPRYITKIYPISWAKFIYTRCLLKRKNFQPKPVFSNQAFCDNKILIDLFLKKIVSQDNITNFSYELLTWKLSLNQNLNVKLFEHDSEIIATLFYSIHYVDNYTLLIISDFLKLNENKLQLIIQKQVKQFISKELIDEVQYSDTEHLFFDDLFTAVKSKNTNLMIYPKYGSKKNIDIIRYDMRISKLVTDHL